MAIYGLFGARQKNAKGKEGFLRVWQDRRSAGKQNCGGVPGTVQDELETQNFSCT
jgi:hypothetical protein